ncbi:hypothetical protein HanIR_Chr12g0596451 [Helianthus annuus]|nr:hypothetical protein HanIR_Chr12g0596451 [Helianthus annuus]
MEPVLNSLDAKKQACDIEKSKDDGDNRVEMFSPYKSKLQRQFSEEDRKYENQKKRSMRLSEWKWVDVINLDDSEDDEKEDEIYQVFLCFFHFQLFLFDIDYPMNNKVYIIFEVYVLCYFIALIIYISIELIYFST